MTRNYVAEAYSQMADSLTNLQQERDFAMGWLTFMAEVYAAGDRSASDLGRLLASYGLDRATLGYNTWKWTFAQIDTQQPPPQRKVVKTRRRKAAA